ncbi:MAG: hypothetical protein EBU46_14450 [Nitrosomonadaceae bacterium]|nr:hypothetical protein [Nitrosomonadaceae bacterium]
MSVPNVIGTSHQRWNPNEVKNLMKTPGMTVGRALTQSQFKHQKVNCPDTKRSASIEFQVKVDSIASKKVKPGLWDLKKIEGADCDMNPKEFDEDPFNDRFMKRGCDLTVYKFVHGSVKRIENGKITKVDNSELEKINGYFPQVPDNNLHITHALIETDTPGKYVRCLITETLASSQDINCLDKVNQIKQLISTKKISSGYLILAEDPKKKGQPLTYKGNRSAYGVITKMIELKKEVIFEVELISVQQEFLAVKNRSPAFKN